MKNKLYFLVILVVGICTGVCIRSAFSLKADFAVVNLKKVLRESPKVLLMNRENDVKLAELSRWLDSVNKEVDSEKDKTKRTKLAEQYHSLAREKEALIKQDYNRKLNDVDQELTALINKVAQEKGCSMVFSATSVVTGGKDITDDVLALLVKKEK